MACHAVQMWSLSGLVAAFLDLTIAYFLLCASAVSYPPSKFLGFFGLNFPCPCDVEFINVNCRNLCFKRLLVDFPIQKLLDVQLSVRQKFPFGNSVSPRKFVCSVVGDNCANEVEGEASCGSSKSDLSSRTGKIDMKGKGVLINRRRLKGIVGHGKPSYLFSYDSRLVEDDMNEQPNHHFITNKRVNRFGDGLLPFEEARNSNLEYDKAPKKMRRRQRTLSSDEDMYMKKSVLSGEELQVNQQGVGGDVDSKIRLLEQALENERAAQAALYVELEKERSAAASAADEAMAMILRLQEEKASIEMEARQYKRIIEEKSAYDDEEMNILEEILVRREKEKLVLEKEVEAYRQMVSGGSEQLIGYFSDKNVARQIIGHPTDPNDLFINQHSASIDTKVTMEMDIHKEIISEDKEIQLKAIPCYTKELDQVQEMNQGNNLAEKVIRTFHGAEKGDPEQLAKDEPFGSRNSCYPIFDNDHHVYDVHIIGDDTNPCSEETEDKGEQLLVSSSPNVRETVSVQSRAARERNNAFTVVKKSNPEVAFCLPPSGLWRSSMSAADTEMLKIDNEVVRLGERLKLVQEGKGKLGFSLEHQESRNAELKILEDIAWQVQHLTETQQAPRQASLPLPKSKGLSKKRRSRSVSSSGSR